MTAPTLLKLAQDAERMPWETEHDVPYEQRNAFRNAFSANFFLEMLEAMRTALAALESCTPGDTSTGHVLIPYFDEEKCDRAETALRGLIAHIEGKTS
ncbi:hypothetical protein CDN99_06545 [Roseateles aquatilis]|uniref:Uncharacterized protein n=1 Tax=Roseateles aquatilis TaxID=431061 RepID=A0A246JHC9_9BURK|nr:hypothetical protein [Roseateles aquatilis]OWQ92011.1 hypothetical protein CDN99_06545 [Roseateles aquatilis]